VLIAHHACTDYLAETPKVGEDNMSRSRFLQNKLHGSMRPLALVEPGPDRGCELDLLAGTVHERAVELAQRVSGRKNRKDLSPPRKLRPMYIVRVAKATRVVQINRTVRSNEKHMNGRADRLTSSIPVSPPCGNNHRSQHGLL